MKGVAQGESRPVMRLYRYLAAKWAVRTLETAELRISRLAELNDPFEFQPALEYVNPGIRPRGRR